MNPKRIFRWNRARSRQGWRCVELIVSLGVLVLGPLAPTLPAQTTAGNAGGFAPGAREIFSLNLAQEPLGEFPKSVRQLSGNMEVVEKDGQRMLRASSDSEFLITLPERLPDRFTLEFDLITRASGYNSSELSFEGTPTPYRSLASAYVTWWQGALTLFGGRDAPSNAIPMPDGVRAEIEGQPAEVRVDFAGDSFKFYVNGQRIYSVPDLKFVRARVLRVGLGGVDAKEYAVHLSRLRIADASTTMPATAQQQSGMMVANSTTGGGGLTPQANPANTTSSGTSGQGALLAITGINVSVGAGGVATVTWNPLPVTATYFVVRWNVNDPACCNGMSPPGLPLTSPVWQDGVLPVGGTYAYRVIGKTANGTFEGQTRFSYQGAPTPPPGVATTTPVYPVPTSTPTLTTTTPLPGSTTTTTTTGTGGTATGTPSTGTIVAPEPPPPAPYSSGPRTVSLMPTTTTTTTSTPTTTTEPAPTTAATTTTVTALPATMTGTIVPMTSTTGGAGGSPDTTSGGPGYVPPRFRVMLTGFTVVKLTNDDPLGADGKGDEAFAAAAIVHWDRSTSQMKSFTFVQTREYGDMSVSTLFPDRLQGGTATAKGGLAAGNKIPGDYDAAGNSVPSPASDRFPLLVWEGELTAGVDSIVVAPSLWERDTVRMHFTNYKANWAKVSAVGLMSTPAVASQYTTATVTSAVIPISPVIAAAPPSPTFIGAVTDGYKIATLAFGPSSDRPIGMTAAPGVLNYQERVTLIIREKLFSLNAGDGITIALPCVEPLDPMLGGLYTLYLRVQRVQ